MKNLTWGILVLSLWTLTANAFKTEDQFEMEKFGKSPPRTVKFEKGKGVRILFFWTSWCTFCPDVATILTKYARRPEIEIISIGTDEEKAKSFEATMTKYQVFKSNSGWLNEKTRNRLNLQKVPVVVLVDKQGRVDTIYEGSQSDKMGYLEKRIRHILEVDDIEGGT